MLSFPRTGGLGLLLLSVSPVMAVDSIRDISFHLMLEDPFPDSSLRFYSYGDTEFESSADSSRFTGERYSSSAIGGFVVHDLWRDETNLIAGYVGARVQDLDSDLSFRSRGGGSEQLPADLASVSVGTLGKHLIDDDDSFIWRLGAHSNSDEPFSSSDVVGVELEGMMRNDLDNDDSIFWGVYWYQRLDHPGPIAGYIWRPTPDWEITFGYPFARLHWQIEPDWELDLTAAPLWGEYDSRLTWHTTERLDLGTRLRSHTRLSWLNDREDEDDVLSIRSWRAGLFTAVQLWAVEVHLEGGYTFGRDLRSEEGAGLIDTGGFSDEIGLDNSFYTTVELSLAM